MGNKETISLIHSIDPDTSIKIDQVIDGDTKLTVDYNINKDTKIEVSKGSEGNVNATLSIKL